MELKPSGCRVSNKIVSGTASFNKLLIRIPSGVTILAFVFAIHLLYIEKNHLFSSDSKILVALSGGADSVALLRILHTAGYHCEAAHCNFHLRGEESNRDESFVRQLCLKYNIRLHTADFNTTQYAAEKHISIEMAARELRYNWFEEIKNKYRADVIAVAHHQDDSIETMLLNLIRGTGITGLLGIRPRNGDRKSVV